MKITIHISESIRNIVKDAPGTIVVEEEKPMSIRQLATNIDIPPILVVFASVDGVKMGLDDNVTGDATIHLFGAMAGG